MPQKWVIETINGPMVQMVRTLNGRKYSQNIYLKKNLHPEFIKKSLTTQEDNQLNNRFEHMLQKWSTVTKKTQEKMFNTINHWGNNT